MISIELKAEFRRGSRETVKNAVARRISIVFEDFFARNHDFPKETRHVRRKIREIFKKYEITENQKAHPRRMSPS